jgi:hypothetical protein
MSNGQLDCKSQSAVEVARHLIDSVLSSHGYNWVRQSIGQHRQSSTPALSLYAGGGTASMWD